MSRFCLLLVICLVVCISGAEEIQGAPSKQLALAQLAPEDSFLNDRGQDLEATPSDMPRVESRTTSRTTSSARRVVMLYGGFAGLMQALGEQDRLVGRTDADDGPNLRDLPSIGTHMRPNFEKILALRPDLVLQMDSKRGESRAVTERLRQLGLRVEVFRLESFADVFSALERLSVLLGDTDKALDAQGQLVPIVSWGVNRGVNRVNRGLLLSAQLRLRLALLEAHLSGIESKPSVFFELRYPNLLGAGSGSLADEIIRRAGGRNVLAHSNQRLVKLDEEELVRLAPSVYIMQRGPMNKHPMPLELRPTLQALKSAKTLLVESEEYARPGPRSVEATLELARFFHPELNLQILPQKK